MTRQKRDYTREQKAEAVALAVSVGPTEAAKQLGYPVRTVTGWLHQPAHSEVIRVVEQTIADRLLAAQERALDVVLEGLEDPDARLGEKAAALRVLGEQANLAAGRATANVAIGGTSDPATWTPEDHRDTWILSLDGRERDAWMQLMDAELGRRRIEELATSIEDATVERILELATVVEHFMDQLDWEGHRERRERSPALITPGETQDVYAVASEPDAWSRLDEMFEGKEDTHDIDGPHVR